MANQKHQWSFIEKESLKILADIVAIAIEQERTKLLIKSSSEELLKSEAKFRIIFDKLPLGIELFDENGKMLNDNNADLEIFGVKQEDLVGLSLFDSPIIPDRFKTKLREGEEVDCMISLRQSITDVLSILINTDSQIVDEALLRILDFFHGRLSAPACFLSDPCPKRLPYM